MSFYEILGIVYQKPKLNKNVKFFMHQDKNYAYLNQIPYKISCLELSNKMIDLLNEFDGNKTVNEIRLKHKLGSESLEFMNNLIRNGVLEPKELKLPEAVNSVLGIVLFPTTTCNLRCVYCYASAGETPAINMDVKKAEAWINYQFRNISPRVKKVSLLFHGGGEPTNNPGLLKGLTELVREKCKELNLALEVLSITNGNFNEEVLNWIIEQKAIVTFSMDGIKADQDFLRPRADGKSSFDTAYKNLKILSANGIKGAIRATVTNINKTSLKGLIDIAAELDWRSVNLEKLSEFGREHDLNMTNISNSQFVESFMELWKYAVEKRVLIRGFSGFVLTQSREYHCNDYNKTSFDLTPEGYLSTCLEVSLASDTASDQFFVGKVNDDDSVEFYEDRIEQLKARKTELFPECKGCFLESVCRAGCPVKSFRQNNALNSINHSTCKYLKEVSAQILKHILDSPEAFTREVGFNHCQLLAGNDDLISAKSVDFTPF